MRLRHAVLLAPLLAVPGALPAAAAQPSTWHAKQARVTAAAQSAGRSGAGVTVAVVDTWIDAAHPDFGGRVLGAVDCTGGSCKAGVPRDSCEHGTHVAGTVASATYGVAPKARILPLRILKWDGSRCTGNTTDAAAAIRYAVSHGAKVVNLSVGGDNPLVGSTTALPGAVSEAARAGVLVVFAAGNDGSSVSDAYGEDALVVAATGPSGRIASYSRTGPFISLAAPGGDPADGKNCSNTGSDCVASTYPDNSYAAAAGTSMAAPHVAGLGALLYAQGRARADVINRMRGTARTLSGAGSGLIDVTAAVGATATSPAPVQTLKPKTTTSRRPTTKAPTTAPPKPVATPSRTTTPPATRSPAATPSPSGTRTETTTLALPADAPPERTVPVTIAALLALGVGTGVVSARRPRAPRLP